MNLGMASDWAVLVGVIVGISTIALTVWKLARSASRLELSMDALVQSQKLLGEQLVAHMLVFRAYQDKQAEVISQLQTGVNRLTWEVEQMREKE